MMLVLLTLRLDALCERLIMRGDVPFPFFKVHLNENTTRFISGLYVRLSYQRESKLDTSTLDLSILDRGACTLP